MVDSVGSVAAPTAAQYSIEVAGKQNAQASLEGKQAVQLIESATAPKLATSGDVGTKLNVVA